MPNLLRNSSAGVNHISAKVAPSRRWRSDRHACEWRCKSDVGGEAPVLRVLRVRGRAQDRSRMNRHQELHVVLPWHDAPAQGADGGIDAREITGCRVADCDDEARLHQRELAFEPLVARVDLQLSRRAM